MLENLRSNFTPQTCFNLKISFEHDIAASARQPPRQGTTHQMVPSLRTEEQKALC